MEIEIATHDGKEGAGRQMYALARRFCADLGSLGGAGAQEFFEFVRRIPYVADDVRFPDRVIELLGRPRHLLDRRIFPALDCKKKSLLIGAWAERNGVPYRFVAVSHSPTKRIHHVFPQLDLGNGWVNADATFGPLGAPQPATYAEVLIP